MNRVAEALNIKYPFIQGPMSWLTNAEFTAAVSNAGGLGILGPNAGQTSITNDATETAERMRKEIKKVQALTNKPFGVTLIGGNGGPTSEFTLKVLNVVIEEKVPVAFVNSVGASLDGTFGIEPALLKPLKDNNIKIVVRSWQPSIADAKAAEAQGADVYVATGFDEGGTLPSYELGSFSIIPMIADSVDIPVCLSGGISDSRTVNAAFALGAEGVFVGSRLIPTIENPAAQNVKELIVHSTAEDLQLFRVAPAYYRSLPTKLRDQLVINDKTQNMETAYELNGKLMNGTSGMRIGMLEGDFENGYISVGTGISTIHEITSVAEVIAQLMADYKL